MEIMFTSGTTGDPKGVMLTHRNLTANVEGIAQYITCDPSSRLLSILPLSHMYEQMGGLLTALYFGASVTYPTSRQPTVLARTMRERRVTTLLLVPQALELLMNGIEREVRRQGKEGLWLKLLKVAGKTPFSLRRRLFGRVHRQFGGKLDFIVSGGRRPRPRVGQEVGAARRQDRPGLRRHRGFARHQQPHDTRAPARLGRPSPAQRRGPYQRGRGDPRPGRQRFARLLECARADGGDVQGRLVLHRRRGLLSTRRASCTSGAASRT